MKIIFFLVNKWKLYDIITTPPLMYFCNDFKNKLYISSRKYLLFSYRLVHRVQRVDSSVQPLTY